MNNFKKNKDGFFKNEDGEFMVGSFLIWLILVFSLGVYVITILN